MTHASSSNGEIPHQGVDWQTIKEKQMAWIILKTDSFTQQILIEHLLWLGIFLDGSSAGMSKTEEDLTLRELTFLWETSDSKWETDEPVITACSQGFAGNELRVLMREHILWTESSGRFDLRGYAAAAKSFQSCPTLCDPIDGSPPGSPVPGILQARTLEGLAISFSNAWKWKVKVKSLSRVRLLATPCTTAHQAPLSMGFSRQEYWSGVPLPSPTSA